MCFSVLHQLVQLSQQVQHQREHQREHKRQRPLIEAASEEAQD